MTRILIYKNECETLRLQKERSVSSALLFCFLSLRGTHGVQQANVIFSAIMNSFEIQTQQEDSKSSFVKHKRQTTLG